MKGWAFVAIAVVITGLALVFASGSAQAQCGGLCLYENMSPDMGRSAAGAGARAQDSSTAFWNPAGMTELGDGTQVMFGLGAAFSQVNPELDAEHRDDGLAGHLRQQRGRLRAAVRQLHLDEAALRRPLRHGRDAALRRLGRLRPELGRTHRGHRCLAVLRS